MTTANGRNPGREDLAVECHLRIEKVEEAFRLAPAVISLDTPLGGVTLGDLLDRPAAVQGTSNYEALYPDDLDQLLLHLDAREEDVLRRRHGMAPHGEKQTLDIGVAYRVTRERIRQVESKAFAKMRDAVGFTLSATGSKQKNNGKRPHR